MFSRIRRFFKDYKEIKYLAYHDPLTGLLNRNWLYKNIDEIDYKYVFFIDINNLKEKNKKGHTAGDKHIKYVVKVIKENLSKDDTMLRYAGDEFLVFSDSLKTVKDSTLYTFGVALHNLGCFKETIRIADRNMIDEKNNLIKDKNERKN